MKTFNYSIINDQSSLLPPRSLKLLLDAIMNAHHFPVRALFTLFAHIHLILVESCTYRRVVWTVTHPFSAIRFTALVHHREVPAEQSEHLHLVSLIAVDPAQ